MGKIIAVANQKGGVGKTTTTINLSAAIAEKDRKVLLVDLDSQSNATSGVGVDKNNVEISTYEFISGLASFDECLVHTEFKNLDLLPATPDLTAAEIELLEVDNRESRLKNGLDQIRDQYEFIIIDCPPSLNLLTVNALVAADTVLIPIQCEYYALEGLSQLLQTINLIKERINADLKVEGVVFTMYDSRVRLSGQVVRNVKENLREKMFRTVIPRNVRLAEAPSHGKPVMYYTRFCSGTRAYRNLAKEIVAVYEAELSAKEKEAEKTAAAAALNEEVNEQTDESVEEITEAPAEIAAEETTDDSPAEEVSEEPVKETAEAEKEEAVEDTTEAGSDEAAEETADAEKEEAVEETAEAGKDETVEETEEKQDETAAAEPEAEIEETNEETKEKIKEEIKEEKSQADKYADIIAKAEKEIQAGLTEEAGE